jgi:phage baseplate assembly protein V
MNIEIIKRAIAEYIKPLRRKILLMVGRGEINSTDDSGSIQTLNASFLAGEDKDGVEKIGHYGLAYHAPKGSDAIMVSIAGARENGIVIATEHREYRFKDLGEGEVALYSDNGDYIHLKQGNVIDVKTKTLNIDAETAVNITSPAITMTASSKVTMTTPEVDASAKIKSGADIECGANVVVTGQVQAPTVAAGSSLTVGGDELNGYATHTHTYTDDTEDRETSTPN